MLEHEQRTGSVELWTKADEILAADGTLVELVIRGRAASLEPDRLRPCDVDIADLLAEGLQVPITAATAERVAHEWLVTPPPQTSRLRAGRQLGDNDVHTVELRVAHLRRVDDYLSGGDLAPLVQREPAHTAHLLREAYYGDSNGRRLLIAIGELCQVAGWVTSDAGNFADAARYYLAGVKAAHAAGDRALGANLISSLAYQQTNVGDPRDGLLLAKSAQHGAPDAAPTARALFTERVAWAAANAGDRHTAEHALATVERLYDQRRDHEPEWTYWLSPDEIKVMAGRCFVALGRPKPAIMLLSQVLGHYDPTLSRERALYLSWLAEAHIQAGDIDQAAITASQCADLAAAISSTRANERVRYLGRHLQPFAGNTHVDNFLERTGKARA